jgi:hypothetical protein
MRLSVPWFIGQPQNKGYLAQNVVMLRHWGQKSFTSFQKPLTWKAMLSCHLRTHSTLCTLPTTTEISFTSLPVVTLSPSSMGTQTDFWSLLCLQKLALCPSTLNSLAMNERHLIRASLGKMKNLGKCIKAQLQQARGHSWSPGTSGTEQSWRGSLCASLCNTTPLHGTQAISRV